MPETTAIRVISSGDTHTLRHRLLRQNQPLEACAYPGDEAPDTVHFGAYADGDLVGIVSLYREAPPESACTDHWRIRGMATDTAVRGEGYGKQLLRACTAHARSHGGAVLWCNARSAARGFYASAGFHAEGAEFELPGIGPHYRMTKTLDGDSS